MPQSAFQPSREMRSSLLKRSILAPDREAEESAAGPGWALGEPGDDVKDILTRQRAGEKLNDRDWQRLSIRVGAENETARRGGRVEGSIQPRRLSALELGQRDRAAVAQDDRELDEYSAGRGFPVRPAGPTRDQLAARRNGLDRVGSGGFAMRAMANGSARTASPSQNGDSVIRDFVRKGDAIAYHKSKNPTVSRVGALTVRDSTPAEIAQSKSALQLPAANLAESISAAPEPPQIRRIGEMFTPPKDIAPKVEETSITQVQPDPVRRSPPATPVAPTTPPRNMPVAERRRAAGESVDTLYARDHPNLAALSFMADPAGRQFKPAFSGAAAGLKNVVTAPRRLAEIFSDISHAQGVDDKRDYSTKMIGSRNAWNRQQASYADEQAHYAKQRQKRQGNKTFQVAIRP